MVLFSGIIFVLLLVTLASLTLKKVFGETTLPQMNDVQVYKDQMRAIEKDRATGTVSDADFQALRADIGRRMLAAAKSATSDDEQLDITPLGLIVTITAAVCLAGAVYWYQGTPSQTDLPIAARFEIAEQNRAERAPQADMETSIAYDPAEIPADYSALVNDLRTAMQDRPDDPRGLELLVQAETRLGNFPAAHQAQQHILDLKQDTATPDDWVLYAELLIKAAGGYISPEAERALRQVLTADPMHPLARFRTGEFFYQIGRPDRTFSIWRDLLDDGPQTALFMPVIRANIDELAALAGVRYTQPTPVGPTAQDIAAATQLSETERATMVQDMVSTLAQRLADEGGPAADWARLINAYGVLGRRDAASAVYEEAQTVFAARENDLDTLKRAAIAAGITK